MEENIEKALHRILPLYKRERGGLLPILHKVQESLSYIPEEAIEEIASYLYIPESEVYSVASFYDHFRLSPPGRKRVAICRGTACHVHGAPQILGKVEEVLKLKEGKTSEDLEWTLETVACFGCCAIAPCLRINKEVYGKLTPEKVEDIFKDGDKSMSRDELYLRRSH